MKLTKTTVTVAIAILMTVVVAMVVRWQFSPAVKDSYFLPDSDKLRQVPAGIAIARPTHFAQSTHDGIKHVHEGEVLARTVGHNVPLREVMAEAYDWNPARVVLPPEAPKSGFDFLVTVTKTRKHLRSAIQNKLGYVAHSETRNTDVLVLKAIHLNPPGLKISADGENADISCKDGRLYFKHQSLSLVLKGLEDGLTLPVQDQTGLTNFYDFSLVWNQDIEKAMHSGGFDLDGVKKVLGGWGLQLEPDMATLDMLIVEKPH